MDIKYITLYSDETKIKKAIAKEKKTKYVLIKSITYSCVLLGSQATNLKQYNYIQLNIISASI